MTRINADIPAPPGGFVTGSGTGGGAPRTRASSDAPDDRRVLREGTARPGAAGHATHLTHDLSR